MTPKVFTGWDAREAAGWHAFAQSVIETSPGVGISALANDQADGTNTFTYSRFRIPRICTWSGWALFVDGCDMLLRADIRELFALRNPGYAVQVVKHDYEPKNARKYVGTDMEAENTAYPRKNWSSVMLINCGHMAHFEHREKLDTNDGKFLHRFGWLEDDQIGELPIEWNWLADEYGPNEQAKLLHWTAGQPGFYHYKNAPHADEWRAAVRSSMRGMD